MERPERSDHEDVGAEFDRIRATYGEQIERAVAFSGFGHGFFVDVKARWLLELVRAHSGDTRRLDALDLGCGIGEYHGRLSGAFASLSAIDVSHASVDLASRRHPEVRYSSYDGARLPYADNAFDVVFTICVLHHVPPAERQGFAGEMMRVTRPGGLAVVFEHNPFNLATQYIVRTLPMDRGVVLLTARTTRRLLLQAGLRPTQTRTILTVPPVNRPMRAADRALGLLPLGAQYFVTAHKRLTADTSRQDRAAT